LPLEMPASSGGAERVILSNCGQTQSTDSASLLTRGPPLAIIYRRRNQKYETKPLGTVPDFDRLHRDLDMSMTRMRSNMRRQLTVPHEFKLNGATPGEQKERERKVCDNGELKERERKACDHGELKERERKVCDHGELHA